MSAASQAQSDSAGRRPRFWSCLEAGRRIAGWLARLWLLPLGGLLLIGYLALATPITLEVDGHALTWHTHQDTVTGLLREAGLALSPQDRVWPAPDDRLGPGSVVRVQRAGAAPAASARQRLTITLNDDGQSITFETIETRLDAALAARGILLDAADRVIPALDSPVTPGMQVRIERAMPITIQTDGNLFSARVQANTVGQALLEAGIPLLGSDFCQPSAETPLRAGMRIQVVRVREEIDIEQESLPFETDWQPDPDRPIDTQRQIRPGANGLLKRRYRIIWHDDAQVARTLEDEWIERPPTPRLVAYGIQIKLQTIETPEGPLQYWRHLRVLATSYSAASAGKDKEHPRYGQTRSGLPAGFGVIAVDPRVIPLGSQVYVPGYGRAVAGDTGPAIVGRRIDLGYDDEKPPHWYRWVDLYLLTPPPKHIRYVLPDWPRER